MTPPSPPIIKHTLGYSVNNPWHRNGEMNCILKCTGEYLETEI